MTDGTIRKATPADLDRINAIAVAAWAPIYEHRRKNVVNEQMFQDMWGGWRSVKRVTTTDDKSPIRVIVTEFAGDIVGFATWRVLPPHAGEILANAVDPAYQGRGLGTRQIAHVLDTLRQQGCRYAKVFTGLDPAHSPARRQYYAVGLNAALLTSVYMNALSSVREAPRPRDHEVVPASLARESEIMAMAEAIWQPILCENDRHTGGLYGQCNPNEIENRRVALRKRLRETPADVRIVLQSGEAVGYCVLDRIAARSCGSISQVGVAPARRRAGAATALCMDAFRLLRTQGMRYGQALTGPGENTEAARRLCHSLRLDCEIPSVWLFGTLL